MQPESPEEPKPTSHNLGEQGEELAVMHLKRDGYQILEQNWKLHHYELDIVAFDPRKDEVVIIEVKTRSTNVWGDPRNAVDEKKIKRTVLAADAYLRHNHVEKDVRFDVFAIIIPSSGKPQVTHIVDAFYPPLG